MQMPRIRVASPLQKAEAHSPERLSHNTTHKEQKSLEIEFEAFADILHNSNCKIFHKNTQYLLLMKKNPHKENKTQTTTITISITDGINYMWLENFTAKTFTDLQQKIGIEGDLEHFFTIFKKAIQSEDCINLEFSQNRHLTLKLTFKLDKISIQLSGKLEIGLPIKRQQNRDSDLDYNNEYDNDPQEDDLFPQLLRLFMFDIYKAQIHQYKQQQESQRNLFEQNEKQKKIIEEMKQHQEIQKLVETNNSQNEDNLYVKHPMLTEQKKRSPNNTNIVLPNKRKVKIKGAKLGN